MARRRKKHDESDLFADVTGNGAATTVEGVALHDLASDRYLNYALSVITSRALPDVRDGLKPVQRRILFTMWQQRLTAEAKHRKCAKVVGDVMGNYHPHGDSAIYDALVRMAQSFSLRMPLIDGSGNFGSLDGDPAAAMRYTECRLAPVASEILSEIGQQTVDFRPNYDGTKSEPVVLPARLPNLLINGSSGIAVGMATSVPPHHPGEVCKALLKLLDNPEVKDYQLVGKDAVQGPDFPTGGALIADRSTLREIYQTGSGSVKLRATWELEKKPSARGPLMVYVTSVPYAVNKSVLVERIADVVVSRKLPLLLDVKDVSTDDVRIELELKRDADPAMVMAYLFKHTPLQVNIGVNLTCLVPTENPEVAAPQRLGLKEVLWHFLHFRLDVVTRRLEHELGQLEKRIHLLEGFALAFDVLDEIIRIIRASDGKADAAAKILKRFGGRGGLDEDQTDAILELKLYRLAKLEIRVIRDELKEKKKRAAEIRRLLKSDTSDTGSPLWQIVRDEVDTLGRELGKASPRRTVLADGGDDAEFAAEDFIVDEDNHVLVTADGWIKRQKEIKDPGKSRVREGDRVLACVGGSTRATVVFLSSHGVAYTSRIIDLPATTGYGEPIQKLFKLADGERIVSVISLDSRFITDVGNEPDVPHALAVTDDGYGLRFSLAPFAEPSTRSGRRFARPAKEARVLGVAYAADDETLIVVSSGRRALLCRVDEVNALAGPGRGVLVIKLKGDDRLLGMRVAETERDTLTAVTGRGGEQRINTGRYELTSRGGRGREIVKTGTLTGVIPQEIEAPDLKSDS
ncbi:DNA gyrase/topoisomerase IV subunit A [Mucisphaera calidilacus]|uniref:DNA topoisomerase (ATP-hydrolyzing) n=1 Tax=Mucisphaera calidilacus TaxID=2527982 RepID=A0A518BTB0_9BACT|nr:DNA topoisomerase IV subunit A [Mucisphaera calidilacus]QDU70211.1 DNA gyrase subunit A [Mucisphaera calidilacus]